jgi:hypothetical protein
MNQTGLKGGRAYAEELKKKIPKTLEGYTVLIEESGVIRPLSQKAS